MTGLRYPTRANRREPARQIACRHAKPPPAAATPRSAGNPWRPCPWSWYGQRVVFAVEAASTRHGTGRRCGIWNAGAGPADSPLIPRVSCKCAATRPLSAANRSMRCSAAREARANLRSRVRRRARQRPVQVWTCSARPITGRYRVFRRAEIAAGRPGQAEARARTSSSIASPVVRAMPMPLPGQAVYWPGSPVRECALRAGVDVMTGRTL